MSKERVYIDMDGVIADFYNSPALTGEKRGYGKYPEMYQTRFFADLPPIPGAREAIDLLLKLRWFDIWILTQPVKDSHHSYSEKAEWITRHFPELEHKIIMTQDKSHLSRPGRILIDDSAVKWKDCWENEGGLFFLFDEDSCPKENWDNILKKLGAK